MKDFEQLYYDSQFEVKKLTERVKMLEQIIEDYKCIDKNSKILLTILTLNKQNDRRTNKTIYKTI